MSWRTGCGLSFRDFDILPDDGARGANGVFSAVVMLIFFVRFMFLEHMVCSQMVISMLSIPANFILKSPYR